MRKIQVPLNRYAHPEYLRDLCNRVERCYFSEDRDWRCIETIFNQSIKAMEAREPKPAPAAMARPPRKLIRALSNVADQLAKDGR
jgi:hypothetical protein